MLDGRNDPTKTPADAAAAAAAAAAGDGEDEAPLMSAADEAKDDETDATDEDWRSVTEPSQPLTNDRSSRATALFTLFVYFISKPHRSIHRHLQLHLTSDT